MAYPDIRGAVIHSDRGTQYTSELYRNTLRKYDIIQSMNSAGGRCHDNARCESMWARLKTELLYDRCDSEKLTVSELKSLIWRYFISYWNNRRICTTNGGLPPMIKRQRYYDSLRMVAQSMMSLRKMCQPILTTSNRCLQDSNRMNKNTLLFSILHSFSLVNKTTFPNISRTANFSCLQMTAFYQLSANIFMDLLAETADFQSNYFFEKRKKRITILLIS